MAFETSPIIKQFYIPQYRNTTVENKSSFEQICLSFLLTEKKKNGKEKRKRRTYSPPPHHLLNARTHARTHAHTRTHTGEREDKIKSNQMPAKAKQIRARNTGNIEGRERIEHCS